jgi:hypothetical protein
MALVDSFHGCLLTAYADKVAEQLSRKVMLIWLGSTPFILFSCALAIRYAAKVYYSNADNRRKAVMIWSNSATADLTTALRNSPFAAIDLIGFLITVPKPVRKLT